MSFIKDPKQPRVYHFTKTKAELQIEDLLLRLEALENEAMSRNLHFKPPEPPEGFERKTVSKAR